MFEQLKRHRYLSQIIFQGISFKVPDIQIWLFHSYIHLAQERIAFPKEVVSMYTYEFLPRQPDYHMPAIM